MIHNEEAVNALERVAAEERGVAAERGALAADLTVTRDQMAEEAGVIGGMVRWWQQRYPGRPAHVELERAHEWAVAQLNDANARIAEVVAEQQKHEIAAAALTEDAARARAEWEAQHPDTGGQERTPSDGTGRLVATGDRKTKAHPVLPRMNDNCEHVDATGAVWNLTVTYNDNTGRPWRYDGRVAQGKNGGTVPIMRAQDGPRATETLDVLTERCGPLVVHVDEAIANPPAGPQLPPGVTPIDPRSAEVTAVDGGES